jgi:hypothetical protein
MRIAGEEGLRPGMKIGEITPPAAGNTDFLADFLAMIEQQNRTATLPGSGRAHHAGRTGADDNNLVMGHG